METSTDTESGLERFLTEQELAERFNVEPGLLERQRTAGAGPPYVRIAPRTIRYRPADVVAWLATRIAGRAESSV